MEWRCGGSDAVCGAGGVCDACPVHGGVTTADEMFILLGSFYVPDADLDGAFDGGDNCTLVANPDQRDSNADGYGNVCDADLNGDGSVDFLDLGMLKAVFFTGASEPVESGVRWATRCAWVAPT